jgi:hypothetical protein
LAQIPRLFHAAAAGAALFTQSVCQGGFMRGWPCHVGHFGALVLFAVLLASCTTNPPPLEAPPQPAPAMAPEIPASIRPEEIVGRWGYGAYHNEADRTRTEAAARAQCGQPVVINRGPNGGVLMYLADSAQLRELFLKGSPSGKNYIGPPGPPGGMQDREIVAFDGRTMILRWMNPEVASRYGTGVYVRCGPEGMRRPR